VATLAEAVAVLKEAEGPLKVQVDLKETVPLSEEEADPVRTNAYGYLDDHPLGYRKVLPTPRYLADRLEATSYLVPGVREFYLRKEFVLKALDDGFNPIEHLHRLHPGD